MAQCRGVATLAPLHLPTLEMWTPRWRWTPEQAAQKSTPRLSDAHSGPRAPQSAHASLPRTPASAAASASPATVLSRDTAVCRPAAAMQVSCASAQ